MAIVAVVGAGVMGTALTWPLTDNGHQVRLVGTHLDEEIIESCRRSGYHPRLQRDIPDAVEPVPFEEMGRALDGVDLVVSGVNSFGVRWLGQTAGPYLRSGQRLIAVTKGLEAAANGELRILPDVLASCLPACISGRVVQAAIGGPCIASELASRAQSCVVFGARDRAVAEQLASVFRTRYYHVWTTSDLVGLELCAALKNAYAIGVGLSRGLQERDGGAQGFAKGAKNLPAAVFAQSCSEMSDFLALVGATRDLALTLPGAGDLYVTCQGGRNVRMGRVLGLGHTFAQAQAMMAGETLEGVETVRVIAAALPGLQRRGLVTGDAFPLMRAIIAVIVKGLQPELAVDEYCWTRPQSWPWADSVS